METNTNNNQTEPKTSLEKTPLNNGNEQTPNTPKTSPNSKKKPKK